MRMSFAARYRLLNKTEQFTNPGGSPNRLRFITVQFTPQDSAGCTPTLKNAFCTPYQIS